MSAAVVATREDRLREHIEAIAGVPAEWGSSDCTLWPARWVEQDRGVRLAIPPYCDEAGARRIIAKAGGLVALWRKTLEGVGIYETGDPQLGDVGLVELSTGPTGCIFGLGGTAFIRGTRGVSVMMPRTKTILVAFTV